MTVETEQSSIIFTNIVDNVALNVPFPVQATNELVVRYGADIIAVAGVHYSVSLVPPDYLTAGIRPIAGFAALSGGTISVRREVPYTQPTDIPTLTSLASSRLEQMFDRAWFGMQQLRDQLAYALKFPTLDQPNNFGLLPGAADRAGKYLSFDGQGRPFASNAVITGTPVSTFGAVWAALLNSSAARTVLDVFSKDETRSLIVNHPVLSPYTADTDVTVHQNRYSAFPKPMRVPGQVRRGVMYQDSNDHVGSDLKTKIMVSYTDEQGGVGGWSAGTIIFGDGDDTIDCYTPCIGIDNDGLIHFWCRERISGNKLHRTSRDWVNFSPIDVMTEDNFTGGEPSFNHENYRSWGVYEPNPDGGVGMVGGGYWTDGTDFVIYHAITDASGTNHALTTVATSGSGGPDYNETAFCAPTAMERVAIIRRAGTSSPNLRTSADKGVTWTNRGDMNTMGIPISGGWLPQHMKCVMHNDVKTLVLAMGHRRPASTLPFAEPYPGPGVSIWYCPLADAMQGLNSWKMGHAHSWTHDVLATTDSYCGMVIDDNGQMILVAHDELSDTLSRVTEWGVPDPFTGPRTPESPDYVQRWQLGSAAAMDRRDIVGDSVETLSAARTVTIKDYGKGLVATTTDAITLPLAADVPADFWFEAKARGAASSLARAGSDTIDGGTSATLADGARGLRVRKLSSTAWEAF